MSLVGNPGGKAQAEHGAAAWGGFCGYGAAVADGDLTDDGEA